MFLYIHTYPYICVMGIGNYSLFRLRRSILFTTREQRKNKEKSNFLSFIVKDPEYYHPEWVGTYNTLTEKYIDYLLNVIFLLVGVGFFIKLLVDNLRERGEQLEEANKKLEKSALYDELTGVPNRRLFYLQLKNTINLAERNNQGFTLFYLDLDDFKEVNDKLGHSTGDILLKKVAKRMSDCLRKSDILARMGGDEFTIILPGIEKEKDITIITQKIINAINSGFDLNGQTVSTGVSIGVSIFQVGSTDAEELIRQADEAMYSAKRLGKNKYEFHRKQRRLAFET